MTITDLTGYTWVGNQIIDTSSIYSSFWLDFKSNNIIFQRISIEETTSELAGLKYKTVFDTYFVYAYDYDGGESYTDGVWSNNAYRTIEITGGTDATNSTLITWLQNNGTLTAPSPTPSGINKTKLGTKSIVKKTIGTKEVIKEVVNGIVVYEKGSPTPSAYDVTFTASGGWTSPSHGTVQIYDGQDETGILLLDQNPANKSAFPMTLQIRSGYCKVKLVTDGTVIMGYGITSNDYEASPLGNSYNRLYTIDKNGSIDLQVYTWDD